MENLRLQPGINFSTAIEIAKRYAQIVRNSLDANAVVYLFGSTARDEANESSDIDIAVVSELFDDDVTGDFTRVNVLAYEVDMRINAQAIAYKDWERLNPFTLQVKTTGVLV